MNISNEERTSNMDSIMPMATTKRHNKIINEFVRNVSGVNFYDVDILTSVSFCNIHAKQF